MCSQDKNTQIKRSNDLNVISEIENSDFYTDAEIEEIIKSIEKIALINVPTFDNTRKINGSHFHKLVGVIRHCEACFPIYELEKQLETIRDNSII